MLASDRAAQSIVKQCLALRLSHAHASAIDTLDVVMQGTAGRELDFGSDGLPPAPFALVVAEPFDRDMGPQEWASFTGPSADPVFRAGVLEIWRVEVWPRFVERYRLA